MNLIPILIAAASASTMSEKDVVMTFSKVRAAHEKFLSDTIQHRHEFERFHENEFIPAVDRMISLLAKGRCKTCFTGWNIARVGPQKKAWPRYPHAFQRRIGKGDSHSRKP
ncbi:MAG TPA: hypothetical protein VE954_23780 [Oligoflexus sp.]|uniref:hypothetical protein n=1 Tax=Oligoflexus sp. TaxID=1971216 RepID=UPI002D70A128|nr:hypothetical protein [Oligoflexus sp.]HYX36133.1 hypothetical protein [Oligoflexus sp.]